MRKPGIVVAGLMWMAAGSAPFPAQGVGGTVSFDNRSDHAVWVTLYAKAQRGDNVARGCIEGGTKKSLAITGNGLGYVASHGGYWPLFEIKRSKTTCAEKSNVRGYELGQTKRQDWEFRSAPEPYYVNPR